MSFGSLSKNAVLAMNKGAALGGFAQETGEGGLTEFHREYGADLIWEIGSGYFGTRDADGGFDPEAFREKSRLPEVKAVTADQDLLRGRDGVSTVDRVVLGVRERAVPGRPERCGHAS